MKYIALCFSLLLVGVDQWFKLLAIEHLSGIVTYPLIDGVLHLTYLENRGAAFGMMNGKISLLAIITIFVIGILVALILLKRVKSKFLIWSLSLIIGGGIGNLIDRLARGFVVDYIDVRLINFAVFNFADCCVVIGTILVMFYILFLDKSTTKQGGEVASAE